MGRITRSVAGRRALIGLIGLGALALAACVPVGSKPAPVRDEPAAPAIEVCARGGACPPIRMWPRPR
jgi:hypothetical protein